MGAMEEVEVEEEQGEVEQEVAAVEAEEEVEVEVEARLEGHRRRRVILGARPGWSAQEGTVAQGFWVASLSQSYQLLSSPKSSLLR